MKKLICLLAIGILIAMTVSAVELSFIFKQNTEIDMKITCFDVNNTYCSSTTPCNITIFYPNEEILVSDAEMTHNHNFYNFTLLKNQTSVQGDHYAIVICEGSETGFSTFYYGITPTGDDRTYWFLVAMVLGGLICSGIFVAYPGEFYFAFLGGLLFAVSGVYTFIYGFINIADMYTRAIGVVLLGLGFIFIFSSSIRFIQGEKEEEG